MQIDRLNTALAQSQMEIEGLKMQIGQLQQKLQLQMGNSNVSIKQLQDLLTLKTQDYQELQTDMMALQEKVTTGYYGDMSGNQWNEDEDESGEDQEPLSKNAGGAPRQWRFQNHLSKVSLPLRKNQRLGTPSHKR